MKKLLLGDQTLRILTGHRARSFSLVLLLFSSVFALLFNTLRSTSLVTLESPAVSSLSSLPVSVPQPAEPKRRPFLSSAVSCPEQSIGSLRKLNVLKSQDGEDIHLLQTFFNGLCNGTYVEMGALNGLRFSNTYVFHKAMGWKGVMVELGPGNYKGLLQNRPNELANVNAAVCKDRRKLHYYEKGAVGGIWEFSDPDFRKLWWKGVKLEHTQEVECKPLDEIFTETVGDHFYFDFFSLDIEGAEVEALRSIDFNKHRFGVIFVEGGSRVLGLDHKKNAEVHRILVDNDYVYYHMTKMSTWFVHKDIQQHYGPNITVPKLWTIEEK